VLVIENNVFNNYCNIFLNSTGKDFYINVPLVICTRGIFLEQKSECTREKTLNLNSL